MEYFGTDGIRGHADFFTSSFLAKFAKAITNVFGFESIVIARDTRESGKRIEDILSAHLASLGAVVTNLGIAPTPVLSFYARVHKTNAGIMISASHNPAQDNGLKVFDSCGYKINSEQEKLIEQGFSAATAKGKAKGSVVFCTSANTQYIDYLAQNIALSGGGISLVLDNANGASTVVGEQLFSRFGCKVFNINDDTSGHNINKDCGAIYPYTLKQYMKKVDVDLGFAFDGDGDRVVAQVGENTLNGDYILQVLAEDMAARGCLAKNAVVGTVMSNLGLEKALSTKGIKLHRVAVGDKNVLDFMKKQGCTLGGEQSGHIINTLYQNTGDGLLTALLLTSLFYRGKINKENLFADCPQILSAVSIPKGKSCSLTTRELISKEEAERLGVNVVIRKSGTEPIVRVMVQGEDGQVVEDLSKELVKKTKELLWN